MYNVLDLSVHNQSYDSRNGSNLSHIYPGLSITQRSLSYKAPTLRNELPSFVKDSASLRIFKRKSEEPFYLLNLVT